MKRADLTSEIVARGLGRSRWHRERDENSVHIDSAAMIPRLIVAIAALWTACNAHNIQLKAHSRECFHETLHADDKMTVTFQVGDREFGGSGNLEIDFWVLMHLINLGDNE